MLQKQIKSQHIHQFLRDLAILLNANVSLQQSLLLLQQSYQHLLLKKLIGIMQQKLEAGQPLSEIMRQRQRVFPALICQLIRAGESSGQLAAAVTQIVRYLSQQQRWRHKIQQALFYPILILSMAMMITMAMVYWVLPQFIAIFNDLNAPLPWLTRALFGFSHQLSQHWLLTMCVIATWIYWMKLYGRTMLAWCFPRLWQKMQLAYWCHSLALSVANGIPLQQAVHLANGNVPQSSLKSRLRILHNQLLAGDSLADTLQRQQILSPTCVSLIRAGEQGAKLAESLAQTNQLLDADFSSRLDRLCKVIEPVIMMLLAFVLGVIILGLYLPILELGHAM